MTAPLPPPPLTLEQILGKLSYIEDQNVKQRVANLLFKFESGASHNFDIGESIEEMDFPCPENYDKNTKIYNLSLTDTLHLRYFIDLCLKMDIIECSPPSQQFGSPVFLTSRKDKQAPPRIIIDSRGVNASIPYSVSSITMDPMNTLKNLLPKVRYGTFVDIKNAFYNLKLSQKVLDSGVSCIVTSFGCFRFKRAITGYAGTPSLLLHYILSNIHLNDLKINDIIELLLVWFDDLSIFSWYEEDIEDHLAKLETFLSRLNRLNLKLNLDKCTFCTDLNKDKVVVLGYEIGQGRITIPDKKVKYIMQLKAPKTLKELQSFIGNLQYYRSLLPLPIHGHMNALFPQVRNFDWNEEADFHFNKIKEILASDNLSNESARNIDFQMLYTDASKHAIGSSLLGFELKDLFQSELPNFMDMPAELKAYFNGHEEIGVLFKESDYLNLFYQITIFLKLDFSNSYENWYKIFSNNFTMYSQLSYLLEVTSDDVVRTKQEMNKIFVEKINQLRAGALPLNNPYVQTFLFYSFSIFSKHKLRIIYLSSKDGSILENLLYQRFTESSNSEIIIFVNNDNFYYLGVKENVEIKQRKYKKTVQNLDVSDREVYTFLEKSMKNNLNDINVRGKILGFFSKTVAPKVMETTGIVYLEILAIYEGLTFFEVEIKGTRTLILTDNVACYKILRNKKIENRKSKLDYLSQKILYWFGKMVSFLSIRTDEQLADFISRLMPHATERLDFQVEEIKPVYQGENFAIFDAAPIIRDKENFINKDTDVQILAVTRGKADEVLKKYEELTTRNKRAKKNKTKKPSKKELQESKALAEKLLEQVLPPVPAKNPSEENINVQQESTSKSIPVPETSDNMTHVEKSSNKIDDQNVNFDSGVKDTNLDKNQQLFNDPIPITIEDNNPIDIVPVDEQFIINDPIPIFPDEEQKIIENPINSLPDNEQIKFNNIDPLTPDPIEQNINTSSNINLNIETTEDLGISIDTKKSFSEVLLNTQEHSTVGHSSNKAMSDQMAHFEQQLNKKPDREEREKMRKEIVNEFLNQPHDNEQNLSNKTESHTEYEESIILLPNANATFERLRIFEKSTFIQLQIKENLSNDVNPTTLKYKQNLLILPYPLYGYIAGSMHRDMVHAGVKRVRDNITSTFYVQYKSKLRKIIEAHIGLCCTCIKSKNNHLRLKRLTSINRNNKFRNTVVAMDILEFSKKSKIDGIKGILVFMDVATQYITLHYLPDLNYEDVENGISQYILLHGHVKNFWADNGKNIRNSKSELFLRKIGSRFLDSAAYKSASRGNIENRIKVIQNLVRIARAHAADVKIKTALSTVIHIVNTIKLIGTKLSPYNLHYLSLYGFEGGIVQNDNLFRPNFSFDPKSLSKRFEDYQIPFKQLHDETQEFIFNRQEKLLKKLNKNRHDHNYKVGQFCVLRRDHLKKKYYAKNKPVFDLIVWVILHIGTPLITIKNIWSTSTRKVNPTQIKILREDLIGDYQLPKKVAKHFKVLTLRDIRKFNKINKANRILRSISDDKSSSRVDSLSSI